jgi:hypothetical protein
MVLCLAFSFLNGASSVTCTSVCGNWFVGNNLSDKPVFATLGQDRGNKHVEVQPLLD